MGRLPTYTKITTEKFQIESIKLYAIIDMLDETMSLFGPIYVSLNKNDLVEKFESKEGFLTEHAYLAYMNLSEFGVKSAYYCKEYGVRSNWIEMILESVDELEDYNKKTFELNVEVISEKKKKTEIKEFLKEEKPKKEKEKKPKKEKFKHFEDNRDYVLDVEPEIVYV